MFIIRNMKKDKDAKDEPDAAAVAANATTAGPAPTDENANVAPKKKRLRIRKILGRKFKKIRNGKPESGSESDGSSSGSEAEDEKAPSAEKRELAKEFVEETLRKGVDGLTEEFIRMRRVHNLTEMMEFLQQNCLQTERNRNMDIGCLDSTRVHLTIGRVRYIHANYVAILDNPKKFICTQAPLPNTCSDFWCMIVQEKTSIVLMMCDFYEERVCKCASYYPREVDTSIEFLDGRVKVTAKAQEEINFPIETKVKIVVTRLEVDVVGQPLHTCDHYHWQEWPDRAVPDADLAPILLLDSLRDENDQQPIVVHCTNGVGRSGVIVLLEYAMELLLTNQPLKELRTLLYKLRAQRCYIVQTPKQYLYVHQVLLMYLKEYGYVDPSLHFKLDCFNSTYKREIAAEE